MAIETASPSEIAPTQAGFRHDYSYYREVLAGQRLPCAFLDLDLFDENVRAIAGRVSHGKTIRVASKSVRCVWALRRIFAGDSVYRGIMAFNPREAAFLAAEGFDDILLGYPAWRRGDLEAVFAQLETGKSTVFMVDLPEHVDHLGELSSSRGVVAPICIDVDMSTRFPGLHFGVRRSSLTTAPDLVPVLDAIERNPGVRLQGMMGYEAQIAGLPDRSPANGVRNWLIPRLKRRSIREFRARRAAAIEAIRARGHELAFVNGGGTGSIESTCEEEAVSEVTVGSGFYSPTQFDYYAGFRHQPAVAFAIEVVRRPSPGLVTCSGGGYVASGPAGRDKLPTPYLPAGARLLDQEGAGEVQTPIAYTGPETLGLGDPVLLRHAKAGELCERFNSLLVISEGEIVDEAPTYRGMGHCFL